MPDSGDALIVTAADQAYADLLRGLISSLRRQATVHRIAVIDLGLTETTKEWLRTQSVDVVHGRWLFPFPGQDSVPRYLMAMTARPYLPSLFESAKTIVWIDSDAWVQDGRTIDMLLAGAAESDMAIAAEIDRAYGIHADGGTYIGWLAGIYRQIYGPEALPPGRLPPPLINCGVFAARRDSAVWQLWQDEYRRLGERIAHFFAEQIALNVVLYSKGLRPTLLPATCNWLVKFAKPIIRDGTLCSPHYPHEKIGIVHLAGIEDKLTSRWRYGAGNMF